MRLWHTGLVLAVVGCSPTQPPPPGGSGDGGAPALVVPVEPVSDALPAGTYSGAIPTVQNQVQMQHRFNVVSKQMELTQQLVPTVILAPSPVGNLQLDGRGGYELTEVKADAGRSGRYAYDPARDAVSFTSGAMKGLSADVIRDKNGGAEIVVNFPAGDKDGKPQTLAVHFTDARPNPAFTQRQHNPNADPAKPNAKPAKPNGEYTGVLHVSGTGGTNLLDLTTGSLESPLPGGSSHRHPAAKADEYALAYAKADHVLVRVVGPTGDPLTDPVFATAWSIVLPDSTRPALSPDGERLAFFRRQFKLSLKETVNSSEVVVVDRKGKELATFAGVCDPAWAADGRLVVAGVTGMPGGAYLPDRQDGLYVADTGLKKLTTVGGNFEPVSRPDVSPDGKRVAFLESNAVWVVELDGGKRTKVTTPPSGSRFESVVWSPDGTALACSVTDSITRDGVYLVRVADSQAVLARNKDGAAVKPGTRLAWRATPAR